LYNIISPYDIDELTEITLNNQEFSISRHFFENLLETLFLCLVFLPIRSLDAGNLRRQSPDDALWLIDHPHPDNDNRDEAATESKRNLHCCSTIFTRKSVGAVREPPFNRAMCLDASSSLDMKVPAPLFTLSVDEW